MLPRFFYVESMVWLDLKSLISLAIDNEQILYHLLCAELATVKHQIPYITSSISIISILTYGYHQIVAEYTPLGDNACNRPQETNTSPGKLYP